MIVFAYAFNSVWHSLVTTYHLDRRKQKPKPSSLLPVGRILGEEVFPCLLF